MSFFTLALESVYLQQTTYYSLAVMLPELRKHQYRTLINSIFDWPYCDWNLLLGPYIQTEGLET